MSKGTFAQNKVEYLCHVISGEGVAVDARKVEDMLKWRKPSTPKQLRGFIGLTGYYRMFVRVHGIISKPLCKMLQKGEFKSSVESEVAFEKLKQAMSSTPVLAIPDFNKPFVLETDASEMGIGAV